MGFAGDLGVKVKRFPMQKSDGAEQCGVSQKQNFPNIGTQP